MHSKSPRNVVVVGGGIAGALLAKNLQDHAHVTLIDPKEYFEIIWASLRSMVDLSFAERSLVNYSDFLSQVKLINSYATHITESEVLTARGDHVPYDYLVIATGHIYSDPVTRTEGLSKYQEELNKIKSSSSIMIIGGGPSGVELAEGVYQTSGGETIVADQYFSCTGSQSGSSWLKDTILMDNLDMKGKLVVDKHLRVEGHRSIFAIGDITNLPELKQGYLAMRHAELTAKNLRLLLGGGSEEKMTVYKPGRPIAFVSLGKKDAVAEINGFTMSGCFPGLIKSGDLFVGKTRKTYGLNS
uniref:FAD/NAD(P)-binding domain-containing protein n=1 Tax=Chenopodium quinoa TaxID=63459 RepID=A0A803MVI5_CHEQI